MGAQLGLHRQTPSGERLTTPTAQRSPTDRISMEEVARRAGVAPSSVSRVLSGHPNVSEVMRNRVLDAVAALGYQPDLIAKSLRSGATMTVGFVVGNISNPLLSEIALGAETKLQDAGYSMLLTNSMIDVSTDAKNIRLLAQRRVDGMLVSMTDEESDETRDALSRAGVPLVLVDREVRGVNGAVISSVLARHEDGITAAVEHLVSLGHRRIALVNGPTTVRPSRARGAALRRVARRFGITAIVRSGQFTAEHGHLAALALLTGDDPPSAIIAGSNQILVGVLKAMREAKVRIPDDVSLVTCDDVPLAQFLDPPLATIQRDHFEIGAMAAELLLELLGGGTPRVTEVTTTYRKAASVGPPKRTSDVGHGAS